MHRYGNNGDPGQLPFSPVHTAPDRVHVEAVTSSASSHPCSPVSQAIEFHLLCQSSEGQLAPTHCPPGEYSTFGGVVVVENDDLSITFCRNMWSTIPGNRR